MDKRTLFIENGCKASCSNNHIVLENKEKREEFFINQVDCIVFENLESSISLKLVNELAQSQTNIIICDEKKFPYSGLFPLYGTKSTFSKIKEQMAWCKDLKDSLWQNIIKQKIANQKAVLYKTNKAVEFSEDVLLGDNSNAEGRFAKKYFKAIFGNNFKRQIYPEEINAGLNYGYTILLSKMARIISGHGYTLQIGVHHIGENNPYNLACDFIEPFRPIIDMVVYNNKEKSLDKEYKFKLITSLYNTIIYKNKKCSVTTAMESFFLDGISFMSSGTGVGEIHI